MGGPWVTNDLITLTAGRGVNLIYPAPGKTSAAVLDETEIATANYVGEVSSSTFALEDRVSYHATVSLYCENSWIARNFGTVPGINAPDFNSHYQVSRDMVLDLTVTVQAGEGPGLFVGAAWQIHGGSRWENPDESTNGRTNIGAGEIRVTDHHRVFFKAGEYLRLQTNFNDAGNNTYAGNRNFRIAIDEVTDSKYIAASAVQAVVDFTGVWQSISDQSFSTGLPGATSDIGQLFQIGDRINVWTDIGHHTFYVDNVTGGVGNTLTGYIDKRQSAAFNRHRVTVNGSQWTINPLDGNFDGTLYRVVADRKVSFKAVVP